MSTNTLHIAVESADEFFDDVLADLRDLEAGEELEDKYVLSLPDAESLERVLSAKNLELLRTVAREDPGSVRELARLVDRDVKNVSQALNRLEEIGLVDLERDGQAKRPVVWYDHLEIELSIGSSDPTDTGTAPA
jgi:predicted transcriptional regulator